MLDVPDTDPTGTTWLDPGRLHWPAGTLCDGADPVLVTPERAGWRYVGLRVIEIGRGEERRFETGPDEMLVLPLSGACVVEAAGACHTLRGRPSVFDGITDFTYLPPGTSVRLTSEAGGTFALPSARAEQRFGVARFPMEHVAVETRGAGAATRQINNFFAPNVGNADRLVAVEVLTPGGNTSSYPPHKHDVAVPGAEVELEEIYYFRFEHQSAFGLHRTYASDGSFDESVTVANGDVFLVPRGYHGPCVAMPGYDMYYLNVLAGPGAERSLAFSDDPAHEWIRQSWSAQPRDPRVPMTSARGRYR